MTRIRFCFAVAGELKYLSHLDLMRLFQRALRRAALPLAYSQGFNPHPRLSLAAPLPVGVTAAQELGDIFLADDSITPAQFLKRLQEQLPAGLTLNGAAVVAPEAPSLAAQVSTARYRAVWNGFASPPAVPELQDAVAQLLSLPEIKVSRRGKGGKAVTTDIRPYIHALTAGAEGGPVLEMLLKAGSGGGVSPFVVLGRLEEIRTGAAAEDPAFFWELHRCALYRGAESSLQELTCAGDKKADPE
jgi:radical SAM-linked protein